MVKVDLYFVVGELKVLIEKIDGYCFFFVLCLINP